MSDPDYIILTLSDGNEIRIPMWSSITSLLNRIQSITVIPTRSDGSVGVSRYDASINFEIYPLSVAAQLPELPLSCFSLKAVSTIPTKSSVVLYNIPISFVSYSDGVFTVNVITQDLGEAFFMGKEGPSARLLITYDSVDISSGYFSLTPPTTPSNPEAIDLGLSFKWASCNLGASSPEEYGDYYAWGEIEPYYEPGFAQSSSPAWKPGKSAGYDWVSYRWCNGTQDTLTKYLAHRTTHSANKTFDGRMQLEMSDDAARVNLGSNWRIPTLDEWRELIDNCTWTWTTMNGVNGYKATSNIAGYTGRWIFLPATGGRTDTTLTTSGDGGCYWTATLARPFQNFVAYRCYYFSFDDDSKGISLIYRFIGYSIRPIQANDIPAAGVLIYKESEEEPSTLPSVPSLTLSKGDKVQLKAVVSPSNTTDSITWSVRDEDIAMVDQSGKVEAIGVGFTMIFLSVGNVGMCLNLTVEE